MNAHRAILDRETAARHAREHLSDETALLREVVDYGTNLIIRCFESSEKKAVDLIILGGLLKPAVGWLDAVDVLVSNGAVWAAQSPARACYEAQLLLLWILADDTERRARQYYVAELRRRRLWDLRSLPGTEEYERIKPSLEQSAIFDEKEEPQKVAKLRQAATEELEAVTKQLEQDVYREINAEFERLKGKRPWYAAFSGPTNFRELAQRLNVLGEYDFIYTNLSEAVHSASFRQQVTIKNKKAYFEPIRHLQGVDHIIRVVLSVAFRAYGRVLEKYRPDEVQNFAQKYVTAWQSRFLGLKSVQYKEPD